MKDNECIFNHFFGVFILFFVLFCFLFFFCLIIFFSRDLSMLCAVIIRDQVEISPVLT